MAFGVTRDPMSGAVRANQAASGIRQYGLGGSLSATRGPVDNAGYEEREMRKAARRRADSRRMAMMAGGSSPLGAAGLGAATGYSGR
jgi:hypothetical protein